MIRQLVKLMLITFILLVLANVVAVETDPYTTYGTVKDENGIAVVGAIITVENINTNETNCDGNDTITGRPIPVTTDSNGIYTFELKNLKRGYRYGDEIIVTAEKDGITGSNSIIIKDGSWGERADMTIGVVENQKKEQWYDNLPNFWILFIMLAMIITAILTIIVLKRRKGSNQKAEQIDGTLMEGEEIKGVTEGRHDRHIIEDEKSVIYECPECTEMVKAEDTNCPMCGVQFAEL